MLVSSVTSWRIGVLRGLRGQDERTNPVFAEALNVLTAQGAKLVEIPDTGWVDLRPEERVLLPHDFKEDLNTYLRGTAPSVKVRTLADLIELSLRVFEPDAHAREGLIMEAF